VSGLRRICIGVALGAAGVVAALPAASGDAATHGLPACSTRALVVTVATNGAGGKVQIYVGLRNRGRHACAVRGDAHLALRDAASNTLLHVYRNPYTRTVRTSLRRGPNNLLALEWQNYCGPGRPLLIVATFGRRRAVEHDAYPGARCELPDVPSELRPFRLPG
jgi:hypothetical protein